MAVRLTMTDGYSGNPPAPPPSAPPPFPNPSSFHFLPSPANPSPSPNPNFFTSSLHHHPLQTTTITSFSATTTLSSLRDLIQLSEATIDSISTLLPSTNFITPSSDLCPCPFNPNHRLPWESLFRHSLYCPSSSFHPDPSLLDNLHYPKTLQSSYELLEKNRFVQLLDDPNLELCFSLDDYGINFNSNFFYKDCPSVVSSTDLVNYTKLMLRLPHVLAAECANFVAMGGDTEIVGFSRDCIRFLPSEMQLVRTEIEAWNEYPTSYSYSVLRAILCLNMNKWNDLITAILVNSPRYGVVIDVPMRDHIALLLRLSLKAIIGEAIRLKNSLIEGDIRDLILKSTCFNCPVLVEAMMWLVTQLSVLYGELNGKLFAIYMLRQCLLNSSMNSSLFPLVRRTTAFKEEDKNSEEQSGENMENVTDSLGGETIEKSLIFVSQVAAAVAALHERSLLEMKMKASRSLTAYQKFVEHANISKGADEERQKRSNYRPILEYDGVLWQRSSNEETNKIKTREELLAEERDYKRRRMTYRGKKVKRSYRQVMRDIIDEYMEEIKQAGGIGCSVKGVENAKKFSVGPSSFCDSSLDGNGPNKGLADTPDANKGQSHSHGKQLSTLHDPRKIKFGNDDPEDDKSCPHDSNWSHKHLEALRRTDRHRDDAESSGKCFSRSPGRSHSQSHEWSSHQREQVRQNFEAKNKRVRNSYRDHKSESGTLGAFDDRYDPNESHDMYEDDVYS